MVNGLEIIRRFSRRKPFRMVVLDFDGTISRIREGWQSIMMPFFTEVMRAAPGIKSDEDAKVTVRDFVNYLTGKQTIDQCERLAEEVRLHGGMPAPPGEYRQVYLERLMQRVNDRIAKLERGECHREDLMVPGSIQLLEMLQRHELLLVLASGTEEEAVLNESERLGVRHYFNGGIFGARLNDPNSSKEAVAKRLLREHDISGAELVGFGDGSVEIEAISAVGGCTVGVAFDELKHIGIDEPKRARLVGAGANAIIADYTNVDVIEQYLFE